MSYSGQLRSSDSNCLKNYLGEGPQPLDPKLPWLLGQHKELTESFRECSFCHVIWVQKHNRILGVDARLIGRYSPERNMLLPLAPDVKAIPPKLRKVPGSGKR